MKTKETPKTRNYIFAGLLALVGAACSICPFVLFAPCTALNAAYMIAVFAWCEMPALVYACFNDLLD